MTRSDDRHAVNARSVFGEDAMGSLTATVIEQHQLPTEQQLEDVHQVLEHLVSGLPAPIPSEPLRSDAGGLDGPIPYMVTAGPNTVTRVVPR